MGTVTTTPNGSESPTSTSDSPTSGPSDTPTPFLAPLDEDTLAALRDLAQYCGLSLEYRGSDGQMVSITPTALVRTLTAFGVTVLPEGSHAPHTLEAATLRAHLTALQIADSTRYVPRSVVTTVGERTVIPVHVVHGDEVAVVVETEQRLVLPCTQVDDFTPPVEHEGVLYGQASFELPELPMGYHTIHVSSSTRGDTACPVIVVPARLSAADRFVAKPAAGLMAQIYSVRDAAAWGIGDFHTLGQLAKAAGEVGSDFVLTNPLHAAEPFPPMEDSPYLPTSRRFTNPIYIRPELIPEAARLPQAAAQRLRACAAAHTPENSSAEYIERNPIYLDKLRTLRDIFEVPREPARQQSFEAYVQEQGEGLSKYAQWCAEHAEQAWAEDDRAHGVNASVNYQEFYAWLQWIADEQLRTAHQQALDAGMRIGLMADLAVGVHPGGADAFTLADVMAPGCSVGAPPDGYNQMGQDWSQPPWHPWKLAEAGYAPWRDMVRTVLRAAGGIRVDHVLGLFRLWWIHRPAPGIPSDPRDGCYVYYDHTAMVGVLVLEAERAGAVVVGEDLGTFEPWVQEYLQQRGVMGTSILWFEGEAGQPKAPQHYRQLCVASVGTHDLPPTSGYLDGEHIALRERLGVLTTDPEQEYATDLGWQNAVLQAVADAGCFDGDAAGVQWQGLARESRPDNAAIIHGLYRFMDRTAAALTCTNLVDIVGDHRAQNQPGTTSDMYRNWCVPLTDAAGTALTLEDVVALPQWPDPVFHRRNVG